MRYRYLLYWAAGLLAFYFLALYTGQVRAADAIQTPVTTMAPNKRIYVNNQFPKRGKRNIGRSAPKVLELTGEFTPFQTQSGPSSITPGRWPGVTTVGAVNRNAPSGIRIFAYFSHFAGDDPIVYPGQGGRSHMHAFFGNTSTSGVSTAVTIRNCTGTTAAGGTANCSAYWVPAMIYVCDSVAKIAQGCNPARNGELIQPASDSGLNVYYKGHFGQELSPNKPAGYWVYTHDTQSFPVGFRMISGDPSATPDRPGTQDVPTGFVCNFTPGDQETAQTPYIPGTGGTTPCPGTTVLIKMIVPFPSCINAAGLLDSPTHNSHIIFPSRISDASYTMKDSEDWFCPTAFPTVVVGVTYKLHYNYIAADVPFWRLSSDNYDTSKPAGYSAHGDWFNGWDSAIMDEWISNCIRRGVDCHDNVLGPGVIDPNKWRVLASPIGIVQ